MNQKASAKNLKELFKTFQCNDVIKIFGVWISNQPKHSVIFRKFPQKCAPSVDWFKPIRERLQKNKKVKANAQGYSHLPTHLMVPTYRSNTNLFKKISLGTQNFIFCQIWLIENSTMSSKQILIGQLWTREGANIQKITQWGTACCNLGNFSPDCCNLKNFSPEKMLNEKIKMLNFVIVIV